MQYKHQLKNCKKNSGLSVPLVHRVSRDSSNQHNIECLQKLLKLWYSHSCTGRTADILQRCCHQHASSTAPPLGHLGWTEEDRHHSSTLILGFTTERESLTLHLGNEKNEKVRDRWSHDTAYMQPGSEHREHITQEMAHPTKIVNINSSLSQLKAQDTQFSKNPLDFPSIFSVLIHLCPNT